MRTSRTWQPFLITCAAVVCAAASGPAPAAHAGATPQTSPAPKPALPDLVPTRIYFDRACDLKAEVSNQGKAAYSGQLGSRVLRNGQTISTNTDSLSLAPGAKATVRLAPRAQLGMWVEQEATWTWEVDYQHKIRESSEDNNSLSVSRACGKHSHRGAGYGLAVHRR